MEASADSSRETSNAERLLELTRAVAAEVHPGSRLDASLGLDGSLESDFGLESLARAELFRRIESELHAEIPDALLSSARTPRDLLFSIESTHRPAISAAETPVRTLHEVEDLSRASSLVDVLERHLERRADQVHIRLLGDEREEDIRYRDLDLVARRTGAGILDLAVRPGATVALMMPTSTEYFTSFFGVIAAGCIPVPIYPPASAAQLEDHLTRHAGILRNAGTTLLITSSDGKRAARLLEKNVPSIRAVASPADLCSHGELPSFPSRAPEDIALLQYTSGSTGNPKGVVVTHANVLANLRAARTVVQPRADDVVVSWLPLYHDMGLIGTWLGSYYYGLPLISMSPIRFLARPVRWLRAIERFEGTISAAPNFAYEICATKIANEEIESLDLSSWRLALNGAEAVSAETIQRFSARFAPCGFRPAAMTPVYGLAECSLALTFPLLGRGPRVESIDRESFVTEGIARTTDQPGALRFVACGEPLPRHEVRVVGPGGIEVPDRHEGRIQFRGPSATRGYFANEAETRQLFHGTWLDSGDIGYTVGRELFVTGRAKDLIIRAGRHIYPDVLEQAVAAVAGVRRGCVAAFGIRDPQSGTERVVVVAETREQSGEELLRIAAAVRAAAVDVCGDPPDDIVLAPPHSVLKTSSGKIRRQATRAAYQTGRLKQPSPPWLQLMRLEARSLRPRLTRTSRAIAELAYAAFALVVAGVAAPLVWISIVMTPDRARRRRLMRREARALLSILEIPVAVRGVERIGADGARIFAANHASYLDGLVLASVLPAGASYVVKKEFVRRFVPRMFFSRLGAVFVERFDPGRGLEDAASLDRTVQEGESLAIFPEATFTRSPGLLPFRMGAFLTAARAMIPIVPVSLRGTRAILRGDEWFPRRGRVEVVIGDPIRPVGKDWPAALDLQRKLRAEILAHCAEPDLEREPLGVSFAPSS